MPCYKPLKGWLAREANESGKRSIVFNYKEGYVDVIRSVPCGQCIGCRLERSRQWAIRCVKEASLYDENCFITLTYDDAHLNSEGSLIKQDFQKFMKRLRKKFGKGIRYYQCGEYGEKGGRPHYHACLFNFNFPDRLKYTERNGISLFTSEILQGLWTFGFSTIGDVTFDSAAYVARYIMKKITGKDAKEHYGKRIPEYTTMSRRPGIARNWYEKYASDIFPNDFMVIRGKIKCKPPKYFDNIYDLTNPIEFSKIKAERKVKHLTSPDNTHDRLLVREKVKKAMLKGKGRSYELQSVRNI